MQTKTIIRCAALLMCLAAIHHRAASQFFGVRVNALAALTGTVAVQLGVRHWFYEDFVGHFLGLHASWVDYRIGNRRRTYDGRAYGIGISYGYAWILSKRWNLVVEAGAGLYRTRDTRRDPVTSDWGDRYIRHARRWTLAPSKLEVSFNYLF